MAREWNGTSDHIVFTVSSALQSIAAGPTTLIAIMDVLDTTDGAIMHLRTSGGTNSWWSEISSGAWNYGQGVAPRALVVPSAATGWAMYKAGKDAGGAALAAGRRLTMPGATASTATAASGLADGTPPGAGGILDVGKWGTAAEYLRARLAAMAIFGFHITNTTHLDSYGVSYANLLSGNGAGAPLWCVHFNQASATDPITDDTGNGGNSVSITGTTIVGNPTGIGGGSYFGSTPLTGNLGILTDTSSMQAMGRRRVFALGALQETATVLGVQERHSRTLGTLTTTDVGLSLTRLRRRTLGTLVETNVTLGLNRLKRKTLGIPADTSSMLSLGRSRRKILGILPETNTTQQMTRRRSKTLGLLTTNDGVLSVGSLDGTPLGMLQETNTVLPFGRLKRKTLGLLSTVDYLLGLDVPDVIPILPDVVVRTGPFATTVTMASQDLNVRTGSNDIVVMTSE